MQSHSGQHLLRAKRHSVATSQRGCTKCPVLDRMVIAHSVERPQQAATVTVNSIDIPPAINEHQIDWARYRRAVGVCIVNPRTGYVFGAQRADSGCDTWQMVQGGIDDGERLEQTVFRELREETSIHSARIIASIDHWLTYDHPPHVKSRLPASWSHLRGQAQRWVLVAFEGDDAEINLDTEHKEFSRWRWMPLADLPSSVVPFKRAVYEQVVHHFQPHVEAILRSSKQKSSSNGNGNGNGHA